MVCDVKLEEIKDNNQAAVVDRLHWFNLHRCDAQLRKADGKTFSVLRIPLTCRNLDQDKDGKYFCKDYENRPDVCKRFLCMRAQADKPTVACAPDHIGLLPDK
jgi:Fe-S-cluster containining protein